LWCVFVWCVCLCVWCVCVGGGVIYKLKKICGLCPNLNMAPQKTDLRNKLLYCLSTVCDIKVLCHYKSTESNIDPLTNLNFFDDNSQSDIDSHPMT